MAKKQATKPQAQKFAKADIIKSKTFDNIERDFLQACLSDDEYTIQEALEALDDARKKGVE